MTNQAARLTIVSRTAKRVCAGTRVNSPPPGGVSLGCQKTDVVALCWYGQIYSVVWMSPEPDSCRDAHVTKALEEYRSPTHKIIAMLHAGRRKLRLKYAALREELRTAQNQVRAVEASRATWRRRAEDAELQLASLKKSLQLD